MPPRKNSEKNRGSANHGRIGAIVATASILALLVAWWLWPAKPALGNDRDVVATTDALFTALTSQNVDRLADCELRLRSLRETGQLPEGAADYLDRIVGQARAGRWDAAARKLYGFIRSQQQRAQIGQDSAASRRTAGPRLSAPAARS